MRIAIWHNLPAGGAKRALYGHIEGLLSRGHHVEAWCPPTAARSFLPLERLIAEHIVALDHSGSAPWWDGSRRGLLQSPDRLAAALSAHSQACAKQISAGSFDCCLATTDLFFGAPPIGRYLSGRSILYLQEPHRWLYEANPAFPWLAPPAPAGRRQRIEHPARALLEAVRLYRRAQRARFEVDNATHFDKLLVNSAFSRETVLRVYGIEAEVCYLGVDTDQFARLDVARENVVAGVGALAPHKRAHLLVDAVARIDGARPQIEWVASGVDRQYANRVRATAEAAGVELLVHEQATDDMLLSVLSRARALVYTTRLEPFGLVPLEAGACGLPVIGIAEGGIRETVVDGVNGLLVAPEASELAHAIEALLSDPALAEQLGQAGRERVMERWTLDAAVERLERALA